MTDKTKTIKSLDSRIAAALSANGEASREMLSMLVGKAAAAIDEAQCIIDAESPRLMDIANDTPDASRELIASNQLRIERMSAAIPRLQQRIHAIDLDARQAEWIAEANKLQGEADELFAELKQIYRPIVEQLNSLFVRARANAAAVNELCSRAPRGVEHTFSEIMPYEDFWLKLALPSWDDPNIVYPLRVIEPDPQIEIALAAAAFAKQFDAKMLMSAEQQNAIDDKREAEQRAKAAADRQRFYQAQLEAERRRVTGET